MITLRHNRIVQNTRVGFYFGKNTTFFWQPLCLLNDCVAVNEAMRFSVRRFGCAPFYLREEQDSMAYKVQTRFGYMNLDKNKPSDAAYYGFWFFGFFWLIPGLIMTIMGITMLEAILILLGLATGALGVYFLMITKKYRSIWWEHKNNYEFKKDEKQKILFYNECIKQGVRHMQSLAFRKKAALIAEQLGIQTTDAVSLFEAASKVVEEREFAALKYSEQIAYDALIRYTECVGYDKKTTMLKDMITVKNGEIEELLSPAVNAEFSKKREHDWAIHGGIASGIAGPVAGLAAAVRVSQENAQIRQNNAQLAELQYKYLGVVAGDVQKLNRQIESLEGQISSHRTKVIPETSEIKIMSNLNIVVQETSISQTGAFLIKASVKCNTPVSIYNELPGVIDGTIAADLYQEKQLVGTALMSLPVDGVDCKPVIVEGMGLSGANRLKGYKIKFRPYHLWEIEK